MPRPVENADTHVSLTVQTLRGAKWTYFSTLVNAALQVLVTAVLARLLKPEAFGLVVMAALVLNFGQFFAQLGITQAIVQRPDLRREHLRAGFWASIMASGFFAAVVWFCAPFVATAFESTELGNVLRFMSLSFFFNGLAATACALLLRSMRFRGIALTNIASYVAGYAVVGLTTALLGWGVWSLVAATLAQSIVASIVFNLLARPSARPVAHRRPYRELLGFGSTLSVTQFLEFVTGNLDTVIVGRASGSAALGFYSRALNLTAMPMYHISSSLSQVLFPSFSRVQDDVARVRAAYVSVMTVFAGIGLPVALGLSGAAREIVQVLLGPQWDPAIPVVRFAGLASGAITLSRFGVVVLQATARLKDRMLMRASQLALFAAALLLMRRWGLVGYASAFALSEIAFHTSLAVRIAVLYGITAKETLRAYRPGLVGGALTFATGMLLSWLGTLASAPSVVVLVIQILMGAVVLGWVVLRADKGRVFRIVRDRTEGLARHSAAKRVFRWLSALSGVKPI